MHINHKEAPMKWHVRVMVILTALLSLGTTPTVQSRSQTDQTNSRSIPEAIQCLSVSSESGIFAGTFGSGLFRSVDLGFTWTRLKNLPSSNICIIRLHPNGAVYVGTFGDGVFFSMDGGDSWTAVNSGLGSLEVIRLANDAEGNLFAATAFGGIYRLPNNGKRWSNLGLKGYYVQSIAITSGGNILVGTERDGVMRSRDGGRTWKASNKGLTTKDIWAILEDREGKIFVATNGGGVFQSTDGGGSWNETNKGLTNKNVGCLAVTPEGELFCATSKGIFACDIGNNELRWYPRGPGETGIRCLAMDPAGNLYAGTTARGVLKEWELSGLMELTGAGSP